MTQPAVFVGLVQDGKLRLDSKKQYDAYITRFEGDEVEVTVRKRRSRRSEQQNGYYWSVVIPLMAEHCGYTRDEMHEAIKAKFLGQEDQSRGLLRIGSTARLNTLEFADLVDRVILWAAHELGVIIPAPDPKWRETGTT
jgi:hypothetical protein